jgi:predicted AlkP superfamily phosphohydrolase/phosphomutase
VLSASAAEALAVDLTTALLDVVDPATGQHPIQAVYRREELYHGPYVFHAPDLIVEPRRTDDNPAHNTIYEYGFGPDSLRSSDDFTGNHALDGILAAVGPDIPSGPIADARLLDIAPTILHALDLPLPPGLDGRVLPLWSQPQDIKWSDPEKTPSSGLNVDEALDAEETATVEQRLRSLGYL